MESDRHMIERIEQDEAWLRTYASPEPSVELLNRTRAAVHDQLEARRLLGRADPEPAAALLRRTRTMIRRELADRRPGLRAPQPWIRWGLAAAACLLIAVGALLRDRPGPHRSSVAHAEEFFAMIETIAELAEQGDMQLALLADDLDELDTSTWDRSDSWIEADAELSLIRDDIESVGEKETLDLNDESEGDV